MPSAWSGRFPVRALDTDRCAHGLRGSARWHGVASRCLGAIRVVPCDPCPENRLGIGRQVVGRQVGLGEPECVFQIGGVWPVQHELPMQPHSLVFEDWVTLAARRLATAVASFAVEAVGVATLAAADQEAIERRRAALPVVEG